MAIVVVAMIGIVWVMINASGVIIPAFVVTCVWICGVAALCCAAIWFLMWLGGWR
jgi:hypothetical protein